MIPARDDWLHEEQTNPAWVLHEPGGYIRLTKRSPFSHVADVKIEVEPTKQRRGIGTHLIRRAEAFAPTVGIYRMEATPYRDNPQSSGFFDALRSWNWEGHRHNGGRRGGHLVDTNLFAWTTKPEDN